MIELYYYPGNANMAPHILLHELGLPFALRRVDREKNEHKAPAFLELNPNGLLPALRDGELVLFETAAIMLHLCDTHAQAGLLPELATPERAQAYKWRDC